MSKHLHAAQENLILRYLQNGHSLTHKDAEDIFGCARLASRISNLRLKKGHMEIDSKFIAVRDGEVVKHVKKYYIIPS